MLSDALKLNWIGGQNSSLIAMMVWWTKHTTRQLMKNCSALHLRPLNQKPIIHFQYHPCFPNPMMKEDLVLAVQHLSQLPINRLRHNCRLYSFPQPSTSILLHSLQSTLTLLLAKSIASFVVLMVSMRVECSHALTDPSPRRENSSLVSPLYLLSVTFHP